MEGGLPVILVTDGYLPCYDVREGIDEDLGAREIIVRAGDSVQIDPVVSQGSASVEEDYGSVFPAFGRFPLSGGKQFLVHETQTA